MKPVRVLHLIGSSGCGGAETLTLTLAAKLDPCRIQTQVGLLEPGWLANQLAERRVPTHMLRKSNALDPRLLYNLRGVIRATRPDILHCHLSAMSLYGSVAAASAGIPAIVHMHGLWRDFDRWRRRVVQRIIWSSATHIVPVSQYLAQELRDRGAPTAKIVCIPNGVDVSQFSTRVEPRCLKGRFGILSDAPLLVVVGHLEVEKGVDLAIDCLSSVRRVLPDACLLVAGDGSLRNQLARQVEALGLGGAVTLLAHVDDVPGLLGAADLVLVPSRSEGFSLAAVEAMAAARPVVALNQGGPAEIVVDGETGRLVPPFDTEALAMACLDLLVDPARGRSLGLAGRRRVERFYSLRTMLERWEELYVAVARDSRRLPAHSVCMPDRRDDSAA